MVGRLLSGRPFSLLGAAFAASMFANPASAYVGQPSDGQLGLQGAVTPVMQAIHEFHDLVNIIIIAITLFVMVLMAYVMWRFRESANPTPSRTTHNTMIEVVWTVVPIIILVLIAVPSFRLLHLQYSFPKPDLTIKATGHQWYWSYQYPDQGEFGFDSYMLTDEERQERIDKGMSAPRLLAVDNDVVVPVNKNVHVLVTANDVIHNWTIPSFGSKVDAVPGRVTSTWFRAEKEGVYYGQCSELCGADHAFMPIAVRVVSDDVFARWSAAMKDDNGDEAKAILQQAELEMQGRKQVAQSRQ